MFDLVQHTWTALFGVPFPQPAPQKRLLALKRPCLRKSIKLPIIDLGQHASTALFGVPSPQTAPHQRWPCLLKIMLEREDSEGCTRPSTRTRRQLGNPLRKGVGRARAAATQLSISSATPTPPYLVLLLLFPFEGHFFQGVTSESYFDFTGGNSLRARKLATGE